MNSPELEKLIEQIWKDADFKIEEKKKVNKIRKIEDNFYFSYCKICNIKIKLPSTYNGNYPLCFSHRNPNDRP